MIRSDVVESFGSQPARQQVVALVGFLLVVLVGLSLYVRYVNTSTPLILDETVYLWHARVLGTGSLTAPASSHPLFVGSFFIPTRDGRRFGQYPIGFPLALAPWVLAGIPWGLNIALAGAAILLLFRFARRLDGPGVAWTAAALTAVSPFFIVESTTLLSHPLTLVLSLFVLVSLERREARSGPLRWAALAGFAIGYAINVSPFVAVPMALVVLERWLRTRRRLPARVGEVAAFVFPILLGVGVFLAVNWRTVGSPWKTAYEYAQPTTQAGFGKTVGWKGGYTPADGVVNTADRLASLNEWLFGWPVTSFTFAAPYVAWLAISRFRRRRRENNRRPVGASTSPPEPRDRWDSTLLLLFAATIGIYVFWFFPGTDSGLGPRYLYAALPAPILFTARGLAGVASAARRWSGNRPLAQTAARLLAPGLILLLTTLGTVPYIVRMAGDGVASARRATRAVLDEIAARGIDRGTILVESNSPAPRVHAFQYQSGFDAKGPLVFAESRSPQENARFVADRGGGPVYYLQKRRGRVGWTLRDTPPRIPVQTPRARSEGAAAPDSGLTESADHEDADPESGGERTAPPTTR